jgi:hypothetical protein
MDEKKIDIKVDEAIAVGQYTNVAAIRHSREEFIFDFAFIFPDNPAGKLIARMILSPAHAKRFMEALSSNVQGYESTFGPLPPADTPPLGFVH